MESRLPGFKALHFFTLIGCILCLILGGPEQAQAAGHSMALKPVVEVLNDITTPQTWTPGNVYWVKNDIFIRPAGSLTVQAGTWIKFSPGASITVEGMLEIVPPTATEDRAVFTSVYDDGDGMDLTNDGQNNQPQAGDWEAIKITNDAVVFQSAIVKYSMDGVAIHNNTNLEFSPPHYQLLFP